MKRKPIHLHSAACECEHAAHFSSRLTPQGRPGHAYGAKILATRLTTVMPGLRVCPDCLTDCWAHAIQIGIVVRKAQNETA